jgi:hypothetical protein
MELQRIHNKQTKELKFPNVIKFKRSRNESNQTHKNLHRNTHTHTSVLTALVTIHIKKIPYIFLKVRRALSSK